MTSRQRFLLMPKVELHVHLDGSFDTRLLYETARSRAQAGTLPDKIAAMVMACADETAFHTLVTCDDPVERTLDAMLDRFGIFLPIVEGQIQVLEELACRFVSMQATQHVLYTEVRYSPQLLRAGGAQGTGAKDADAREVVAAITRGLERGCREHPGIEIRQILCLIDGCPGFASELVELAASYWDAGPCSVVGVDIAAGEKHFEDTPPPDGPLPSEAEDLQILQRGGQGAVSGEAGSPPATGNGAVHRAAVRRCACSNIPLTLHAGESGPASHVAASAGKHYGCGEPSHQSSVIN